MYLSENYNFYYHSKETDPFSSDLRIESTNTALEQYENIEFEKMGPRDS